MVNPHVVTVAESHSVGLGLPYRQVAHNNVALPVGVEAETVERHSVAGAHYRLVAAYRHVVLLVVKPTAFKVVFNYYYVRLGASGVAFKLGAGAHPDYLSVPSARRSVKSEVGIRGKSRKPMLGSGTQRQSHCRRKQ